MYIYIYIYMYIYIYIYINLRSLQTIARNMYTVILVVNPYTYEGAILLMQIHMMYQQQYPIRFGIVLASEKHENEVKSVNEKSVKKIAALYDFNTETSTVDINRLFSYIRGSYDAELASSFLFGVASIVTELAQTGQPMVITRGTIMEVFSETLFEYEISDRNNKNKNSKNIVSTKGTNIAEIKRDLEAIGENILIFKNEDVNVMNEHDEFIFNSTQYIKVKDMYIYK
jgi:hypothetical protein